MTIGNTSLIMSNYGCVVTGCATILSYYLKREITPKEFLDYCNHNHGFTWDGLLYWAMVTKFSGGKLRFSYSVNPKKGETVYGIRKVNIFRGHWVTDYNVMPQGANKIIDPLTGTVLPYDTYKNQYAGLNRFFIGKQ